ncbi:MAG: hypothetical protein ACLQVF_24520 [Isosphaeraceae bacterium]
MEGARVKYALWQRRIVRPFGYRSRKGTTQSRRRGFPPGSLTGAALGRITLMGNATAAVMAMDKMLDQLSDCLNAEAAQRVVGLRIDPEIQTRVEVLADKANEGLLSEEERDEYKTFIEMADLIAILKLKAQRFVPSNGPV